MSAPKAKEIMREWAAALSRVRSSVELANWISVAVEPVRVMRA